MEECGKCKIKINTEDKFIACDSCHIPFHLQEKCCNMSSSETRAAVLQKRILLFFCDDCRSAFKNVPMLIRKIEVLNSEVEKLKKAVSELKSQNNSEDMESMLIELHERNVRSNNLMVYNVSESKANNLDDKVKEDKLVVAEVLKKLDIQNDDEHLLKVIRVGKVGGNRPRPLKAVFSNSQIVRQALKSKAKLYSTDFRISQDQTRMQQDQFRSARAELKDREDKGEQNLTIKYIKGIPKIVKKDITNTKN